MQRKTWNWLTALFLAAQAVLYWQILTAGGDLLRYCEFGAIALCFVFAALHFKRGDRWIIFGLLCTVGADTCLVLLQPIEQLWGMVFFLSAQTLYAIRLYRLNPSKVLLHSRIGLVAVAQIVTVAVLQAKTDPLALISLAYYAMLIMNIAAAFADFRKNRLFAITLVLFLLCDTVVGLQVAAGGYLPIAEGSALHRLLFSGFNLAWFFYLPSQVGLALCAVKKVR